MSFKGIYKEKSSSTKFGILFLLIVTSVILNSLLALALFLLFTENGMTIIMNQDLSNSVYIYYLKHMQLFSSIGFFITPTLLYAYITNFNFRFRQISRQNAILVIAIIMLITPFISLILEWNTAIDFPNWITFFDMNSESIIAAFLQITNIWDLCFTILVMAIVPAIGEELLFRCYLQQKTEIWAKNSHVAILVTAFLFSIIHFDSQGLIPRLFLGVLLGYLFYWSKSLWLPILAHFINNTQAIFFSLPSFENLQISTNPLKGFLSLFAVLLLLYILYQSLNIKNVEEEPS